MPFNLYPLHRKLLTKIAVNQENQSKDLSQSKKLLTKRAGNQENLSKDLSQSKKQNKIKKTK